MSQHSIALMKSAYKHQFAVAMIKNGLSPDYYFRKFNLPTGVDEDPESLLPVKPIYLLSNYIAKNRRIKNFGAQAAALTPWHKISSLVPLIASSKNLGDMLEDFCKVASGQSSVVSFSLENQGANYQFCYTGSAPIHNDIQMELYRITGMIQLIQLAAGSGWRPEHIQLLMRKNSAPAACELLKQSKLTFSQVRSCISVPAILLRLPVKIEITANPYTSQRYDMKAEFVVTLRQIVTIYVCNGNCKIDTIADAIDIPVRSLQQRLQAKGLKFNDLLNQIKYSLAKYMLENSSLHIRQISSHLRYTDAAHFTRAFRRWAGISPSQYRANL
jgi:AraC-like DNA-binding protein